MPKAFWSLWLVLLVICPAFPQQARSWEVFTPAGAEWRAHPTPVTVDLGVPTPVDVPSAATGTGLGTRLTDVEVVVTNGLRALPAAGPASDRATALAEDHAGVLWVATDAGLSRFDGSQWTTIAGAGDLLTGGISALGIDGDDHVWVSGVWGVGRLDGETVTTYKPAEEGGFLTVAPSGEVWIAGLGSVLYRYDGRDWWRYTHEDGLPWGLVTTQVVADRHGGVWVTIDWVKEYGSGVPDAPVHELTHFDGHQWTSYDVGFGGFAWVQHAFVDNDDRLWVSAGGGLLVFDGRTWRQYGSLRLAGVSAMVDGGGGKYYLSNYLGEFGCLQGGLWTFIGGVAQPTNAYALLFDSRRDLWIADPYAPLLARWPHADLPTAVEERTAAVPSAAPPLLEVHPNPFNSQALITFRLSHAGPVLLQVFDAAGRIVTRLAAGAYATGTHQTAWDGRDTAGRTVASGVYFCQLADDRATVTRRLALVR